MVRAIDVQQSILQTSSTEKIQQIQQLQALGIDLNPILPNLLEIPDLETAYSVTTASYDYTQSVIQKAAETGEIDFLGIANMEMLFSETVRWMLRLSADEANKKYLDNLTKLLNAVVERQKEATQPPEPPVPAPTPSIAPPPVPPVVATPPVPPA